MNNSFLSKTILALALLLSVGAVAEGAAGTPAILPKATKVRPTLDEIFSGVPSCTEDPSADYCDDGGCAAAGECGGADSDFREADPNETLGG